MTWNKALQHARIQKVVDTICYGIDGSHFAEWELTYLYGINFFFKNK